MKISEIFKSIQGEGRFAGRPAIFVRVSGCTRKCDFCDTQYHNSGKELSHEEIISKILSFAPINTIVWTGGEPTLYLDDILDIKALLPDYSHHIETNGDIMVDYSDFDYVCFSPKDIKSAKQIEDIRRQFILSDVKVATDLVVNKELIPYATMLMPLTRDFGGPIDIETKQRVWTYCVTHNIAFSPRLHVDIWYMSRKK